VIVVEPKWMFSFRGGMVPLLVCTQESTTLGDFGKLVVNSGMRIGPVRGLSARR